MGWFKGKSKRHHGVSHEISVFPGDFPFNQSNDKEHMLYVVLGIMYISLC